LLDFIRKAYGVGQMIISTFKDKDQEFLGIAEDEDSDIEIIEGNCLYHIHGFPDPMFRVQIIYLSDGLMSGLIILPLQHGEI
jgi:hypothetical protein